MTCAPGTAANSRDVIGDSFTVVDASLYTWSISDHFCSDTDDFGRGFGLVIILMFSTPIVAVVAVRRLLVRDKAGFACLAVLVASIGLVAATLGNTSFCPS